MKNGLLTLMLLAAASCTTPTIADPRFDFPDAPNSLMEDQNNLEPIFIPAQGNGVSPQ